MKRIQLAIVSLFLIVGCADNAKNRVEAFNFDLLVGDWKMNSDGVEIVERWAWGEEKLIGTSFEMDGIEMKESETITIENLKGTPVYSPTVMSQNDGKAIPFTSSFQNSHRIEFTNQLHDFPQVICYDFITNDSMDVTISAFPLDENSEKLVFHFRREH